LRSRLSLQHHGFSAKHAFLLASDATADDDEHIHIDIHLQQWWWNRFWQTVVADELSQFLPAATREPSGSFFMGFAGVEPHIRRVLKGPSVTPLTPTARKMPPPIDIDVAFLRILVYSMANI